MALFQFSRTWVLLTFYSLYLSTSKRIQYIALFRGPSGIFPAARRWLVRAATPSPDHKLETGPSGCVVELKHDSTDKPARARRPIKLSAFSARCRAVTAPCRVSSSSRFRYQATLLCARRRQPAPVRSMPSAKFRLEKRRTAQP